MTLNEKHLGSDFDDFLREKGLLDEAETAAPKRVLAYQTTVGAGSTTGFEYAVGEILDHQEGSMAKEKSSHKNQQP